MAAKNRKPSGKAAARPDRTDKGRFKKGFSGNPKGRLHGSFDRAKALEEAIALRIRGKKGLEDVRGSVVEWLATAEGLDDKILSQLFARVLPQEVKQDVSVGIQSELDRLRKLADE